MKKRRKQIKKEEESKSLKNIDKPNEIYSYDILFIVSNNKLLCLGFLFSFIINKWKQSKCTVVTFHDDIVIKSYDKSKAERTEKVRKKKQTKKLKKKKKNRNK